MNRRNGGPGNIFWLASYPKSGNTWVRSFIKALQDAQREEVDINALKTGAIASSHGWIGSGLGFDIDILTPEEVDRLRPRSYRFISDRLTEAGFHKVHDANYRVSDQEMLFPVEATRGVLYIVRNPLDVSVSLANHLGTDIGASIGHLGNDEYGLAVGRKGQPKQVRQRLTSWAGHVASWLEAGLPTLLVRYEDMRLRPLPTFRDIARFLMLPCDEQSVARALEQCRFERFQTQEAERGFVEKPRKARVFFRKGRVGDWRNHLSADQAQRIIDTHGEMMCRLGYLKANGELADICG